MQYSLGNSQRETERLVTQASGMQSLSKDQRLNYDVESGRNGKESAVNLSAA